jgi:archaemetzincin
MPADAAQVAALRFLTIADFPRALAQDVVARVSRRVAVPCRLLRTEWEHPLPAVDGREQADADRLLKALEEHNGDPRAVLVGLTLADLGNPIFTFFFGRARLAGNAVLVSFARLEQERYGLPADPELTRRRGTLEVLHELGHVGGLRHCDAYGCLMHHAHSVEELDLRGTRMCEPCLRRVPSWLRTRSDER